MDALEKYSASLLELVTRKADLMDFQDLYYETFDKQATPELQSEYIKAITPVGERLEDEDDYNEFVNQSYEESYSYDSD